MSNPEVPIGQLQANMYPEQQMDDVDENYADDQIDEG